MKKMISLIILLHASWAFADPACDLLEKKLNFIRAMQADFSQSVQTNRHRIMRASGSMALKRPGRLRWFIQHPHAQIVIADGKRVWVYDRSLEQVTVKPERQGLGGVAGLFLTEYHHSVAQHFQTTMHEQGKNVTFDLHAKSHKVSIQRVMLRFEGDQLVFMQLFDQMGQKTAVNFHHIHINGTIPAGYFNFKPPAGVDVIQQ